MLMLRLFSFCLYLFVILVVFHLAIGGGFALFAPVPDHTPCSTSFQHSIKHGFRHPFKRPSENVEMLYKLVILIALFKQLSSHRSIVTFVVHIEICNS